MRGLAHPNTRRGLKLATSALALLAAQGLWNAALANPTGGTVTGGSATIATRPGTVTVRQGSDRAVIEWQDFSVDAGETTRFVQPSASSVTLNRVTGDNASVINGRVTANGNVFLVNRNGVLVGADAVVDVGGLVATTTDIDDGAFMAGSGHFDRPTGNPGAVIANEGAITVADKGIAALVGPTVENHGVIAARLGTVALGSAETFTVDLAGDGLISFDTGQPVNRDGGTAQVTNAGTIAAEGGTVVLSAGQAASVVDKAIDMTGVVTASSVSSEGGVIVLSGGAGETSVSGTLDVSGTRGGAIEVTGDTVGIEAGARLDASGETGGGTIKVGGDLKGGGTTPHARKTAVAEGATLDASATENGDGGLIVVWSDASTFFGADAVARGGAEGGDGGLIETSSASALSFGDFSIDASASAGQAGEWLIDPADVVIGDGEAPPLTSNPFDPVSALNFIQTASIVSVLATGTDVTINTGATGDGIAGEGAINQTVIDALFPNAEDAVIETGSIAFLGNPEAFAIGGDGSAKLTLNAVGGIVWQGSLDVTGDFTLEANAGKAIVFFSGGVKANTIDLHGCMTVSNCGIPESELGNAHFGIALIPVASDQDTVLLSGETVNMFGGLGGVLISERATVEAGTALNLQGQGEFAFVFDPLATIGAGDGATASFLPAFDGGDLEIVARDGEDSSNAGIDQFDLAALSAFETIALRTGAGVATLGGTDPLGGDGSIRIGGASGGATVKAAGNLVLEAGDGGSVRMDGGAALETGGDLDISSGNEIDLAGGVTVGGDLRAAAETITTDGNIVSTGGGIRLDGDVVVFGPTTLRASADIDITGNVNAGFFDFGESAGAFAAFALEPSGTSLVVTSDHGAVDVGGDIGLSEPLDDLVISAATTIDVGSVVVNGFASLTAPLTHLRGDRYDIGAFFEVIGATLLCTDVEIDAGGDVLFAGTIDAEAEAPSTALDVDAFGSIAIKDRVGGDNPITALVLEAGDRISLAGATTLLDQGYDATGGGTIHGIFDSGGVFGFLGDLELAGDTTISAVSSILFDGTIDNAEGEGRASLVLNNETGSVIAIGPIGAISPLQDLDIAAPGGVVSLGDTKVAGDLRVDAATMVPFGTQYEAGGFMRFGANMILAEEGTYGFEAGGDVTFSGIIDAASTGDYHLVVRSTGGDARLLGAIGTVIGPLSSIEVEARDRVMTRDTFRTTGDQRYFGGEIILGTGAMTSTEGNILIHGPATVTGPVTLDAAGNLKMTSTVDGTSGDGILSGELDLIAGDRLDVLGEVGMASPLLGFRLTAGTAIDPPSAITFGPQVYSAPVIVLSGSEYATHGGAFTTIGELRLTAPAVTIDTTDSHDSAYALASGDILLDGPVHGFDVILNAGSAGITAGDVAFDSLKVLGTMGSADMGGTIGGIAGEAAAGEVIRPEIVETYLFNGCVMATDCGNGGGDDFFLPDLEGTLTAGLPLPPPAGGDERLSPPNLLFARTFDFIDDPRFTFSNTGKDGLWRLDLSFPGAGGDLP
ncbi:filamentous hemagglutinin N-terminal domain-containing protein [Zavarzinia compransoris]|uniref:two-partner secretion domain-containing protein n=1 Tax=Zavarzinia marina TaxID=2911065 RepID=UPI001F1F2778|nr:filamentous hemagglutinin N-terminal domain-containing protein [Zavarzinia marina]MCF4165180.1 filamentous hemagglutinin N-terminal domain-containing protein [Zavarzinia marina]